MEFIPFNKPHLTGKEAHYIYDAVYSKKISGNGKYTQLCHKFFEDKYGFKKTLLTTSCTDALEMAALLVDIQPGDEVIMPSYTFVSTANAFVLRGAKIVFADSEVKTPNIDVTKIESLITEKTKVIVPVHYAGISCDMDAIMEIAKKYNLWVIEDAAQAVDSYYKGKALGGIGHLGAFSFHETKNVISGEGGMLIINDERFIERAEIIWEKGTNRAAFWRGEVDKYHWIDVGSSFLPSEIVAAFLYAQLENLEQIQKKRIWIWQQYYDGLKMLEEKGLVRLPHVYDYATNNGHMFFLVCNNHNEMTQLIEHLSNNDINALFHYLSLHQSPFYKDKHDGRELPNCEYYANCLLRLPVFYELQVNNVHKVCEKILAFYKASICK
ncbi:MAG: dTDP-4-amino-4,6-dideoxygalactose transaminase [Flavobacteriales bacterium]|nr:MAG: dTDP-4-amino-4,6-dideoxygalactose transaminase [Flavobacteriales bacterium]